MILSALSILFLTMFGTIGHATDIPRPQPEISTAISPQASTAQAHDFMIVTANPLATKAGYDILDNGGTAADAAIAAQLVLGLIEPQSSGLGGGAFALYFDADSAQLSSWDGRETAPSSATPDMFLKPDDTPMDFWDAVMSAQSVGVPGTPALLEKLHDKFGKTSWRDLFTNAITLSENGFTKSPRLLKMIKADTGKLDQFKTARDYFYNDAPILKNPDYATTLKTFAAHKSAPFYNPKSIGGDIIKTTESHITEQDLRNYKIIERTPVCAPYKSYKICGMGEPSSGGLTVIQALKILEPFDLKKDDPQSIHLIAEASKLAFSDRNYYMADPDFIDTPSIDLLDETYIAKRRNLIKDTAQKYTHGTPSVWKDSKQTADISLDRPGTSHIVAIDTYGNAISMTTTIETAFGSKRMTNGFLLNNELTDFSFTPSKDGIPIANRVQAGKRPRSSMAPTIVFDKDDKPLLLIGSAGGSHIIGYVLQRLISILDWEMNVGIALSAPSFLAKTDALITEKPLPLAIHKKKHRVKINDMNSGLTAIHIQKNTLIGAADPRREGLALGR